jgi:uncharacterized membrane protein
MGDNSVAAGTAVKKSTVVLVYGITLLGTLAWLVAIFLAPYLKSRSAGGAAVLYAMFAPVCHQIPERSFFFRGFPLAVCGRCLGIYSGFLAGLLLYPFVRGFQKVALPPPCLFLALSAPIVLDFTGGILGFWTSPIWLRFATGFLWGPPLPFFFITGVTELLGRRDGHGASADSLLDRRDQKT